jgi:hypothetical protein
MRSNDDSLRIRRHWWQRRVTLAWMLLLTITTASSTSNGKISEIVERRPIMHTYFEEVVPDLTGMTQHHHAEFLYYWKQSWFLAGWDPVVLTKEDAMRSVNNLSFDYQQPSSWSRMLLHKWMAMSERGGWMCDYDVFPLYHYRNDSYVLPDVLTLHEAVAPTLVSGTAGAWQQGTLALLRHYHDNNGNSSFWTDTLALLDLRHDENLSMRIERHVVQADLIFSSSLDDEESICAAISKKRKKWVIHFGPLTLQRAVQLPEHLRFPQHRVTVARDYMDKWERYCNRNETEAAT